MEVNADLAKLLYTYLYGNRSTGDRKKNHENLRKVLVENEIAQIPGMCERCGVKKDIVEKCHKCNKFQCGPCYGYCITGPRFYNGRICRDCWAQIEDLKN